MLNQVTWIKMIGLVGLCLGAAGLTAGFLKSQDPGVLSGEPAITAARPVKSMVIQTRPDLEKRTFPGLVEVANETRLAFRVNGTLHELNPAIGQSVKKGDLIARLDPRDFELNIQRIDASLDEAQATLRAMESGARKEDIAALTAQTDAARANLERSKKQLGRLNMLIKQQVITKSMHDQGVADYKTSKASYDAAVQNLEKARNGARQEDIDAARARIRQLEANLSAARYALEDTRLTAPFDGIINQKFIENYETVAAGHPVISIMDVSTVDVKTAIPEEVMLKRNEFNTLSCQLDAYPEIVFEARIKELGLKTNTANQSFPLTVTLTMPAPLDIQPGMTASLTIAYAEHRNDQAIYLPAAAVFADNDGTPCAWKIDPETHRVSKVAIQTRGVKDAGLIVTAGLNAGERVVTAGARFLTGGQKVRIMEGAQGI